jgi:tRNA-Thr(GGU) m(6)t(6)A37 methyltransferase TsaA
MDNQYIIKPIGIIRTPFTEKQGTPIQGALVDESSGTAEVFDEFKAGLKDLDGFSHAIFLYYFDRSHGWEPLVVPYLDDRRRGVFATRAPRRPNPIGLTVVKLLSIEDNIIEFKHTDMLDGTPLLDIKPYIPKVDAPESEKPGWLNERMERSDSNRRRSYRADDRF